MHPSSPVGLKVLLVGSLLMAALGVLSCGADTAEDAGSLASRRAENGAAMRATLQRHLDAVSGRDLETLRSTLSPDGRMLLILPQIEMTTTADDFMKYHEAWFADTAANWTFDTKILSAEAADSLGMAVTEIVYREPIRDGKPYFNRMIVSYDLKKVGATWYVIKDHASSVEKSTD